MLRTKVLSLHHQLAACNFRPLANIFLELFVVNNNLLSLERYTFSDDLLITEYVRIHYYK